MTYNLVACTYHTVDHSVEHPEGEHYTTTQQDLAETLVAIGFADLESVTITATGAQAGIPGTWIPAGASAPANLAAMTSITATPATPWTTGQHMVLGDATHTAWSGVDWVGGDAPLMSSGRVGQRG